MLIPASVISRTLKGATLSPVNASARKAGEVRKGKRRREKKRREDKACHYFQVWNVTLFASLVAGERAVNTVVIVALGRVIPRMASVLVAGDLLGQNVKSPAQQDITVLTVYKSAPDVTQVR